MSNLINPWLIEGYVDEQDTKSAQGCYIGADRLFEGEQAAEKAIRERNERWLALKYARQELEHLQKELEKTPNRYCRKKELLTKKIEQITIFLKSAK